MFSLKSVFFTLLLVTWSRRCCARPETHTTTEDTMVLENQSSEEARIDTDDGDIGYRPLPIDYEAYDDVIDNKSSTHSPLIHSTEYD